MSQKGSIKIIIIIIGILVIVGTAGYFFYSNFIKYSGQVVGERNGHKLIRVQRCSDYCPPEIMEKSWVIEYAEGTTPQKCRDIGGYPKRDPAWGEYFGCSPDPVNFLYIENLVPATSTKPDTTTTTPSTTSTNSNTNNKKRRL